MTKYNYNILKRMQRTRIFCETNGSSLRRQRECKEKQLSCWISADSIISSSPAVRECGVYCEVKPYTTPLEELKALNPIGIIFTGGPELRVSGDLPPMWTPPFSPGACRFWASATAVSSWPTLWGQGGPRPGGHRPGVRQDGDPF